MVKNLNFGQKSKFWSKIEISVGVNMNSKFMKITNFFPNIFSKAAASGLMVLLGFLIGGAANLISAACSADLGKAAIALGIRVMKYFFVGNSSNSKLFFQISILFCFQEIKK